MTRSTSLFAAAAPPGRFDLLADVAAPELSWRWWLYTSVVGPGAHCTGRLGGAVGGMPEELPRTAAAQLFADPAAVHVAGKRRMACLT